jgi:hypothetical protein
MINYQRPRERQDIMRTDVEGDPGEREKPPPIYDSKVSSRSEEKR